MLPLNHWPPNMKPMQIDTHLMHMWATCIKKKTVQRILSKSECQISWGPIFHTPPGLPAHPLVRLGLVYFGWASQCWWRAGETSYAQAGKDILRPCLHGKPPRWDWQCNLRHVTAVWCRMVGFPKAIAVKSWNRINCRIRLTQKRPTSFHHAQTWCVAYFINMAGWLLLTSEIFGHAQKIGFNGLQKQIFKHGFVSAWISHRKHRWHNSDLRKPQEASTSKATPNFSEVWMRMFTSSLVSACLLVQVSRTPAAFT